MVPQLVRKVCVPCGVNYTVGLKHDVDADVPFAPQQLCGSYRLSNHVVGVRDCVRRRVPDVMDCIIYAKVLLVDR
jgi:hypothetical protein